MLTKKIQCQRFELIRDAIGRVLTAEFANQKTLDSDLPTINIFLERTQPLDKEELPAINIIYAESSQEVENTSFTTLFDNKYLIEVYTNGEEDESITGDQKAALLLAKIIGMCRAILMNNQNLYLDFTHKFIQTRKVQAITRTQPRIVTDAYNSISGALDMHYFAEETTELEEFEVEALLTTVVKLENTEKGYQFIISET
jgi:hypothetical protein